MKRVLDLLIFHFGRLGRVGLFGLALTAAALLADFLVLRPMESEWSSLAERNQLAALALPARSSTGPSAKVDLPVAEAAGEALRQLFKAAARNGLTLDQGDYTLSSEKEGDLHHYQITLPVSGSYPSLRAFIAQALNDNPALALNHMAMERGVIEDVNLDSDLRFTLFLRETR
jgi:hypothetical protein